MEADGGGGITEQPFGFTGKLGHTSLPGLQDLEVLSEAKVKQRWPGCLECKHIHARFHEFFLYYIFIVCNIFELQNKYDLLGPDGQKILFLREDSTCFMRWCCGKTRALSVIFEDSRGDEVLRLERPLRCSDCCCDFCYPDWTQVAINSPNKIFHFTLKNAGDFHLLRIEILGKSHRATTWMLIETSRSLERQRTTNL